jgi:dTDP-4-dehydrorhamnose reductase
MKVLLTGAGGLLASAIVREFTKSAEIYAVSRRDLDIADEASALRLVESITPDVIINCAAYNLVDRAETDRDVALRTNAAGPRVLMRASVAVGAILVHYGTDFVFDGDSDRPYVETDATNPRGVYAWSKMLGEWFALESPRAYVLRTESLFGLPNEDGSRQGSLDFLIGKILGGGAVPVFVDRTITPAYTTDLARATRALVEDGAAFGVYHGVNSGAVSWVDIASEAARLLGKPLNLEALTLESANLAAPRPRYSALSNEKLRAIGIDMPSWQDALGRFFAERTGRTPPTG